MRRRLGRRAPMLVLVSACALVVAALPAAPQAANDYDARNNARGESGQNPDCISCHRSWGMYDSHIVHAQFPQSLKRGEPGRFEVRVDNPWTADLRALRVTIVQPPDAAALLAPVQAAEHEVDGLVGLPTFEGELGSAAAQVLPEPPPRNVEHEFRVHPRIQWIQGHLSLHPLDPLEAVSPRPVEVRAQLIPPGRPPAGNWTSLDAGGLQRTVRVDGEAALEGQWRLRLEYVRGDPPRLQYAFHATAMYGDAGVPTFEVPVPPTVIGPRQSATVAFEAAGPVHGTYELEVHVRATIHYWHRSGGGYDWDNYTRVRTSHVVVADQYVGPLTAAGTIPVVGGDARTEIAILVGFASAALLPPALVVAGTYGRGSRRFFNNLLGGARRRVMFHSAVSLGLSGAALVHVALFLLDAKYTSLKGLLWGGLGLVALLGLALTGYYQVPLIQRFGHRWWRNVHLLLGALAVAFTAWHALMDGSHFLELKRQVPEVFTRWNLSEA